MGSIRKTPGASVRRPTSLRPPAGANKAEGGRKIGGAPVGSDSNSAAVDEMVRSGSPASTSKAIPAEKSERIFQSVVADLSKAAQRETAEYALRRLESRGGKAGEIAKQILDEGALVSELPGGFRALVGALTELIEARAGKKVAAEAHFALTDELTNFRYGERHELGFRLEEVKLDDLPRPKLLASTPGFLPGVEDVRVGEPSMHDLDTYVNDRLGAFVVKDLVERGRTIEFHQSSAEQALASLSARGFTKVLRAFGPKSNEYNHLYLAQNPTTGELRYAMGEISGQDRLAHMQKLVSLARVPGPGGDKRVKSEQVRVFADPLLHPEDVYRRYSRALLASGSVPPSVVIGFKSGILREMGRRAVAARQVERLQGALGKDPVGTLRRRAKEAGAGGAGLDNALAQLGDDVKVLTEDPSVVFRFNAKIQSLREVERALTALVKSDPEAAKLLDDVVGEKGFKVTVNGRVAEDIPPDTFIDQSVIAYTDEEGRQRSLLVTRNPYGDLAHELGRVLVDNDVENVFVVGTAGGLEQDGEVGDLHAPSKVVGADGRALPFENRVIELLASPEKVRALKEAGARVKLGGTLKEVDSPLDETKGFIGKMQAKGYDLVEMELADLVRATSGSDTKVSGLYVVSDLPGTDRTLESQSAAHAEQALHEAGDLLIAQLGIRDVTLVGDKREPRPEGFEGAIALADRVLKRRGLLGDEHAMLRYTLGRYLYNGLGDKTIDALVRDDGSDPLASPQLASRWRAKATRELGDPFVNGDVVERLRELGRMFKEAVETIEQCGGKTGDYKLHLLGSIVKGRAGKGSDVDVLIECPDKELADRVFKSKYGYAGAPEDSPVVIGGYEYAMSRGSHYGPMIDLGDARGALSNPDFLVEIYANAVKPFGIGLEKGASGEWGVKEKPAERLPERETEEIAERVLEYEKSYRDYMGTDFLLRHLEDTAPLADVSYLPFQRLVARGEAWLKRLPDVLTKDRVLAFLETPEGEAMMRGPRGTTFLENAGLSSADALKHHLEAKGFAGLPMDHLLNGEMAGALLGIGEPLDRLALDLAACERAKKVHDGNHADLPPDFPFFAGAWQAAQRKVTRGPAKSPLEARLFATRASTPQL